jgi:hypothetical protein
MDLGRHYFLDGSLIDKDFAIDGGTRDLSAFALLNNLGGQVHFVAGWAKGVFAAQSHGGALVVVIKADLAREIDGPLVYSWLCIAEINTGVIQDLLRIVHVALHETFLVPLLAPQQCCGLLQGDAEDACNVVCGNGLCRLYIRELLDCEVNLIRLFALLFRHHL